MKQRCEVAGHLFDTDLSGMPGVDGMSANYKPFLTDVTDAAPLFTLRWSPEPLPAEGEVVLEENPEREDMQRVLLRRSADGWWVTMAPFAAAPFCFQLRMSSDFSSGLFHVPQQELPRARFALDNSLMLMFAFATAPFDTLEIHSSTVVHEGRGYAFMAPSGTGKSTHSSLWMKHLPGTWLLNDDNPVLRVVDGVVRIFGTPWSGKTPCYKNASVPLGAMVQLAQAPRNTIRRINELEAYCLLLSSSSGLKAMEPMATQMHRSMEKIVLAVRAFHLDCLPDEEAARVCCAAVTSTESRIDD